MRSYLLVLAGALLLLPAQVLTGQALTDQALAGAKENVAALAPSGLVLAMDEKGNELVVQNADQPFVPASVAKIVTAWLALEVLAATTASRPASTWTATGCSIFAGAAIRF